ncbi:DUF6461 domain-containing protein [Actinoplanes couchii]|uniref:Uncharacterized protein n=1 Tax=Actinoplanes couchii TaxID=403638 RepID=A0ABQ3XLC3_9ACTN|nr:DUF6461 domain-containing protein [Actinoplanes couchii]MDR6318323.1 hypothetical protein [Actinoplanes couchii]GID59308.1 hypothetical protein Aco03nite_077120 [Actinoplanes couchii]
MIDELAAFAVAAMPGLIERIPAAPARLLGRIGAPEDPVSPAARWPSAVPVSPRFGPRGEEAAAVRALRSFGPMTTERLLGALELFLAGPEGAGWSSAPGLADGVSGPPPGGQIMVGTVRGGDQQSEAVEAAALLDRLYPGAADRTAALTQAVAGDPAVAALLTAMPDGADEAALAARHGAVHLALAITVAGSVIEQVGPFPIIDRVPATVGLATGVAALLLRDLPMPREYAAAFLAKIRAEYLFPRHSHTQAAVAGHRFALTENGTCPDADFSGNGLAAAVDGGVVIRTGVGEGSVRVEAVVLAEAPAEVEEHWPDVVEVSWHAETGLASLREATGRAGPTPPWPGDYRVRVHARGRDDGDAAYESYRLVVWAAPAAPPIVHRSFDRLGHRLRGEPEPVRAVPPQHAYRWVQRTALTVAATVTVVTGTPFAEVLRAFGADPDQPEPFDRTEMEPDWITALDTGDAVVVVEFNGYYGSRAPVLQAASGRGRAASMFWNVNAVTRLSFAERGELLAGFEPMGGESAPPKVAECLAGIDFGELGDRTEKGLVAVERFTGHVFTADELAAIEAAGSGYRVKQEKQR